MSTPPHHPTYNVHASHEDIRTILREVYPDRSLLSSAPLPHGESYNNRIYHVSVGTLPSTPKASVLSLVLKVGGNVGQWKNIKTLNEVMCLKLVKFHCPDIPVPEVVAWSNESGRFPGIDFEWILMTKLPGRTLQSTGLASEDMETVADDLAKHLSALRHISSPSKIGNVADVHEDGSVILGRLVDASEAKGWPFDTYLKYQQSIFLHNIENLEKTDAFRPNHHLLPSLRLFFQKHLPEISLFKDPRLSLSVFTHYDFSGRNILVSNLQVDDSNASRMSISGIVDFEFSGFFSPFEEYHNGSDEMFLFREPETDGLKSFTNVFLDKLERLGVSTPRSRLIQQHWKTASHLARLQENIAPWWLYGVQGEELITELEKAANSVIVYMQKLTVSNSRP